MDVSSLTETVLAAAAQYRPLVETTGFPALNEAFSGLNLADFVNAVFRLAISLGAMLAVLRIVYAGFLYMGSDVWSSKEKARHTIRDAVLGLVTLLVIVLILEQINPNILKLNITIGSVNTIPTTNSSSQNQGIGTKFGL